MVMRDVAERWGARQLIGVCRSTYGRVLATSGDWVRAEDELVAAVADLEATRPGQASGGLSRLGELRARQGRTDEARALYERAGTSGVLGLGELDLVDGRPADAADAAERVLRRLPAADVLGRVPALELLVRARAELGRIDEAREAFEELERAGALLGTPYLLGRVRLTAGRLALAAGDHEEARRASEDAIDRLTDASAPYDAAVARISLARALLGLRREDSAAAAARAARDAFAALGAVRELAVAEALLADLGDPRAGGAPRRARPRRALRARGRDPAARRPGARRRGDRRAARAQPAHRAPARGEHPHEAPAAVAHRRRRLRGARRVVVAPANVNGAGWGVGGAARTAQTSPGAPPSPCHVTLWVYGTPNVTSTPRPGSACDVCAPPPSSPSAVEVRSTMRPSAPPACAPGSRAGPEAHRRIRRTLTR